ncbi:hypothetical protein DFJ74DRAFT_702362 [Hyaloraphidium curvatum]|nr:hypothetical protein DFJ74DRAFT_702362 [Hyaloraphidium curvatum]
MTGQVEVAYHVYVRDAPKDAPPFRTALLPAVSLPLNAPADLLPRIPQFPAWKAQAATAGLMECSSCGKPATASVDGCVVRRAARGGGTRVWVGTVPHCADDAIPRARPHKCGWVDATLLVCVLGPGVKKLAELHDFDTLVGLGIDPKKIGAVASAGIAVRIPATTDVHGGPQTNKIIDSTAAEYVKSIGSRLSCFECGRPAVGHASGANAFEACPERHRVAGNVLLLAKAVTFCERETCQRDSNVWLRRGHNIVGKVPSGWEGQFKTRCTFCMTLQNDAKDNLKRCGRCRTVAYGSITCQKADYAFHKDSCRRLAEMKESK